MASPPFPVLLPPAYHLLPGLRTLVDIADMPKHFTQHPCFFTLRNSISPSSPLFPAPLPAKEFLKILLMRKGLFIAAIVIAVILEPEKENENLPGKVWEGITGAITEIFENQRKDQIATEVPLKGDVHKMKTGVWVGIWNVFSNAFVRGFRNQLDYSIGEDRQKGKKKK